MEPHLNHLLPWQDLVSLDLFVDTKTKPINFKTGECNKIHLLTKRDKNLVKRRKYISEEQICKDKNCKTTGNIQVGRPNQTKKWKLSNNCDYIFNKRNYHNPDTKKLINFFHHYYVNLEKFGDSLLERLMKRKRYNYKERMFILPKEYGTNFEVEPYDTYYYNYMYHDIYEKEIVKKRLEEYYNNGEQQFCANDWLYAFLTTENDDDLLFLFNIIMKNPELIFNVISMTGSQCYGCYALYIHNDMMHLYMMLNIIIASGNFDNTDSWDYLNGNIYKLEKYFSLGDFHSMVPKWAELLFDIEKYKRNKSNNRVEYDKEKCIYIDSITREPFRFRDYIKVENVNEVLKKIFRYQYTWVALYKFSERNMLRYQKKNKNIARGSWNSFNCWYELEDITEMYDNDDVNDDECSDSDKPLFGREEMEYFNPLIYRKITLE